MNYIKEISKYLDMKSKPNTESVVDGTWTCKECGAWNAAWIDSCGRCETEKETV